MTNPGRGHTERRLAAILAADVAGYSRLMGAGEAGTAQALREHLAAITMIVTSHGGRVVKTTGDSSWSREKGAATYCRSTRLRAR